DDPHGERGGEHHAVQVVGVVGGDDEGALGGQVLPPGDLEVEEPTEDGRQDEAQAGVERREPAHFGEDGWRRRGPGRRTRLPGVAPWVTPEGGGGAPRTRRAASGLRIFRRPAALGGRRAPPVAARRAASGLRIFRPPAALGGRRVPPAAPDPPTAWTRRGVARRTARWLIGVGVRRYSTRPCAGARITGRWNGRDSDGSARRPGGAPGGSGRSSADDR